MRYVSINTVPNGSTGAVMRQVTEERRELGDECWCMWGRGRAAENDHEYNFGTTAGTYLDALQTRIDGRAGFHSRRATMRLLAKLDEIRPDVVHLHNVHGYYVNVEMLFEWLAEHEDVHVKWTLHDCWAFTGHCAYFTYVGCDQWRDGSRCAKGCPQLDTYPKTACASSSGWSYLRKQACFTQLPPSRMTLVTPSHWLEGLVKESFLAKYPVEVRHNTIDKNIFKPTQSDFRQRNGIGDRFMILGVASPWTERKGLGDFVRLASELDSSRFVVVLVGLNRKEIKKHSGEITGCQRTKSPQELAAIYTAADVFVHPGIEETFGMTVAESIACGTPVVVRANSACVEASIGGEVCTVGRGYEALESGIIELANNRSTRGLE